MAGLFDTLSLGSRSLDTYRKAIDTTGHNLANVNTPGYTRQRLLIEATTVDGGAWGPIGTGSEAVKIVQLKNAAATKQLQTEASIEGSLAVKQDALQQAQVFLQESIDRNGTTGTNTKGISQGLADFFAAAQSVATTPGSLAERAVFLEKAQDLATKFNTVDSRLASLQGSLNERVTAEVGQANGLLQEIANLNEAIISEEALSTGFANDLRDTRQLKLEELSKLAKIDTAEQENGAISVRDGEITALREQINTLAATFITEVNGVHAQGFGLEGSTGANFFNGTNAADIAVNPALLSDPKLYQAAGVTGEAGDNTVAKGIASLSTAKHAALDGLSFSNRQAQTVAGLGQQVASANSELADQKTISQFVRDQRDAVSGVSIDEEMTNLIMFQSAFQASAKLISMTDEMLATIIEM